MAISVHSFMIYDKKYFCFLFINFNNVQIFQVLGTNQNETLCYIEIAYLEKPLTVETVDLL